MNVACGAFKISSEELLRKNFEVLAVLLKLSCLSFMLSDLVLPSKSLFTDISDGSLEISKLVLEETPKVVFSKVWREVSLMWWALELFEME